MKNRTDRLNQLISLLRLNGTMEVSEIAKHLGVSEMTIRRDLNELQEKKFVERLHGRATLLVNQPVMNFSYEENSYNLGYASNEMNEEKIRIAKYAANLVKPGEIIILDGGSTADKVADYIPDDMELTVVCYTLNILTKLPKKEKVKILLAGGYYHPGVQVFESLEGIQFLKNIRAHKLFLSVSGVHPTLGMTCANNFEIMFKKTILESALTKILVADSTKFGSLQTAFFSSMDVLDIIITDSGLSEEWGEIIKSKRIELIIV